MPIRQIEHPHIGLPDHRPREAKRCLFPSRVCFHSCVNRRRQASAGQRHPGFAAVFSERGSIQGMLNIRWIKSQLHKKVHPDNDRPVCRLYEDKTKRHGGFGF